jgi:uncharacterized protein YbaR (Trm112 family)
VGIDNKGRGYGDGLQSKSPEMIFQTARSCYNQTMKRELMEILACPVCKGGLELDVEAEGDGEVITGYLHCPKCDVSYPIVDSIPNLLPPEHD